jgi:plasmid stabilization system protein ParE
MNLRIASAAESEIAEALSYYERQSPGLGCDLLTEFEAAARRIIDHPEAWRRIGPNSRRCLLRRFPYGIVYAIQGDIITMTAFMALRRDPQHWDERID